MNTILNRRFLHLPLIISGLMMPGIAAATALTMTDWGITYTLSTDGINYGNGSYAQYNVSLLANTSGFLKDGFGPTESYINAVTIQAKGTTTAYDATTSGPAGTWSTLLGGENQAGCDATGAASGQVCAYFKDGGNPITTAGVLMGGTLAWEFQLKYAFGTTLEQALSLAIDGSHIKADYYHYVTKEVHIPGPGHLTESVTTYDFLGQTSKDASFNYTPPCTNCGGGDLPPPPRTVPEPSLLALMGVGILSMAASYSRRRKM
jgi:hypothetical protein